MCQALNEPTKDSHKWIEVAMKFYNQEVAKLLYQEKAGLLRIHSSPDIERLQYLTKINPDLKFLAYESAVYTSAQIENPYHYGLETALYTHATSPIRRYADLVNQRIIKSILNKEPIPSTPNPYYLNYGAKQAKKHDRDLIFIRALKNQTNDQIIGQIIQIRTQDQLTKISIYVPDWQLVIKVKYTAGLEPNTIISKNTQEIYTIHEGQNVNLKYYFDMTARSWKKRLIIKLSNYNPSF